MSKSLYIILIYTFLAGIGLDLSGQQYEISPVPFNSNLKSEFSPVFYGTGLVFTSNERSNSIAGYLDNEKRLYNIYYIARKGKNSWDIPRILSPSLTTEYNDGPVTFNKDQSIIYFSRNNDISKVYKDIDDTTNTLGIYSAKLVDGVWTNISSAPFNNLEYNYTTPSLEKNGERLFFSSDIPGGEGGFDLYYCDIEGDNWSQAINLGEKINTPGDESFPHIDDFGRLYFSSDSLPGNGGLDIYYTSEINGKWSSPVHLDSTINSTADDFGIVIDSIYNIGYFSSNRGSSDDIYSFQPLQLAFDKCTDNPDELYCYILNEKNSTELDKINFRYIWHFNEGIDREGFEIIHCFPGPGTYEVGLTIINRSGGDTITNNKAFYHSIEQADDFRIQAPSIGLVDSPVQFDLLSPEPDTVSLSEHYWNKGIGFEKANDSYSASYLNSGVYNIILGVTGYDYRSSEKMKLCITKKIMIFDSLEIMTARVYESNNLSSESLKANNKSMLKLQTQAFLADNLMPHHKELIDYELKSFIPHTINFRRGSTISHSDPLLSGISRVLSKSPDLGIEIVVHGNYDNSEVSINETGKWAREITVYFLKHEIPVDSFSCRSGSVSELIIKPEPGDDSPFDGLIEFIFFSRESR